MSKEKELMKRITELLKKCIPNVGDTVYYIDKDSYKDGYKIYNAKWRRISLIK